MNVGPTGYYKSTNRQLVHRRCSQDNVNEESVIHPSDSHNECWTNRILQVKSTTSNWLPGAHRIGLGLLFPKYYLIFHSEFPKLLPYYSLRVDPLFHKILLAVSQKRTCISWTFAGNKKHEHIWKPQVEPSFCYVVGLVAEWVDAGHSETEWESAELLVLAIYISTW